MRGFWVREVGGVRLLTPYVAEFVPALKEAVPFRYLHWDANAKSWVVKQPYVDSALTVAGEYYDRMTELSLPGSDQGAAPSPPPGARPAHNIQQCLNEVRRVWGEEAALYLLPGAPWEVVQAAYRTLAKLYHPDTGSPAASHEAMSRVNGAYGLLSRRQRETGG